MVGWGVAFGMSLLCFEERVRMALTPCRFSVCRPVPGTNNRATLSANGDLATTSSGSEPSEIDHPSYSETSTGTSSTSTRTMYDHIQSSRHMMDVTASLLQGESPRPRRIAIEKSLDSSAQFPKSRLTLCVFPLCFPKRVRRC
jgi:hypothetical protein